MDSTEPLTVFVLIPSFEIRYIFYALGLILIIPSSFATTAGGGARLVGKIPKVLAGSVVMLLLISNTFFVVILTYTYSYPGTLVYQKETPYSHLDVVELGLASVNPINNTWKDKEKIDNSEFPTLTQLVHRFDLIFVFREATEPATLRAYAIEREEVAKNCELGAYDGYEEFVKKYLMYARSVNLKMPKQC
jgi:hypothetical protein